MSLPRKIISPPSIFDVGSNFIKDMAVTDLPHPDSPTIPIVSPSFILKLTSFTLFTIPLSV